MRTTRRVNNKPFILFFISVLAFSFCASDSKEVKENTPGIEEEFLDEGFVSDNTYRIIIVEPREYVDNDNKDYIRRAATRGAMLFLQRYLRSKNRAVDSNTTANILNLINDFGELKMCIKQQERRNVHSFEIKKPNLKQYLDNMVSQR